MLGKFTEEAQKVLVMAKKEMIELRHPYVGSEHLILSILKDEANTIAKKLKEYNIGYKEFREELVNKVGIGSEKSNWFLYTPLLKRVIENAIINSKENNEGNVTIEHLFMGLLEEGEGVAIRIFLGMGVDIDNIYRELSNSFKSISRIKRKEKFIVEEYGTDLTKLAAEGKLDLVIGRDKEIQRILEILCRRTKNNPILIGEAGVGKTALVEELSNRIVNNNVPTNLRNKRIITLDMASLVAGTKYRGEFEERIKSILKELEETDEIILFIDEMHTLIGAGGAEGAIDASNILKPALARNKMRCIGATTIIEYNKYIETDSALERRFQKVLVEEPNEKQLKEILLRLKTIYESYHNVVISDDIINKCIELSKKYIYDRKEPDKTIDLLDEVCAKVSLKETKINKKLEKLKCNVEIIIKEKNEAIIIQDFDKASSLREKEKELVDKVNKLEMKLYGAKNTKEVTVKDLIEVINIKTKIPVYELELNDTDKINKIRMDLKKEITGQNNAIDDIVNILKRIKLGFKDESRPYSFMFVGPTGVGKTKLATLYGNYLVGQNNVIKLDMSEFSEPHSISKIIGAAPGYVGYMDNKNILEEIRNKPYSLIIVDEIEKAHPNIVNLFLQILDEGKIKDAKGTVIRFDNTVIIFTSNLGFGINVVGFNKEDKKIFNILKEKLSLEFVNRLDNVVLFNKLSKDNIIEIIKGKMKKLKLKMKDKNIIINFKNSVVDEIIEASQYNDFGARKIDKIIRDKIESKIIDNIILGKNKIDINSIEDTQMAI
jgi:ATP-dependent Clp protease ATP-binding subunit ClpC